MSVSVVAIKKMKLIIKNGSSNNKNQENIMTPARLCNLWQRLSFAENKK